MYCLGGQYTADLTSQVLGMIGTSATRVRAQRRVDLPTIARMLDEGGAHAMSLPEIDWQSLTDDELDQLIQLAQAEQRRRWEAQRPPSLVDDLRAAIRAQQEAPPREQMR